MKELEPTTAAPTASITTTKGNTNEKQGLTEVAGMGVLQNCSSFSSSSKAAETFEDLYDYECDNSSTSTGFGDHDDEPDKEDEEGIDMDRQFHLPLPRNSNHHRLHEQHHYSDDDDDEEQEEDKNVGGARKEANPLDHAYHRASLDHSHGGGGLNSAEERKEVQATTTETTTSSVTSSSAADNGVDVNDMSSSPSSSHSECSGDMSSPDSDAEDVNGSDGIRQNRDDLSTSPTPPPLVPQQPQQEDQQQHNNNQADDSSFTQETANACSAANPPELNPKNPSRSHLSIPRSIHFLATTPSDRPGSGAASPLGRLQIHTVNRLEVENSFLLNQNNSLTRDIHHCRQTVQALKQILAQREDTIGRMKQEAHQAHLKIKFMESLLSGQQQHHLGQPQQHQQQQQLPQQQQHKGLEGDWKERHRQEDDDEEYDDDDDDDDEEEEEEEEEGEDAREEGERGSSSLLDMFAQSEQPFDWLLKGWDEGEMPLSEGDSDIERRPAGDDDEDEEDQDEGEVARGIPRPVLSIFSGVHDDERYNSDEYIDDDGEKDDEDEEEQDFGQGAARPRSGEFEHRIQGSGIYHHQRSSSGEASALALSMSLSNNSTCILSQCGSSINNNDSDDEDDDNELDDPCDASVITALNGDRVSGCAYAPDNRPQSPASLSSPALSESSMSLESHSEGSNGSVTSLSCSSLTSNSTADEKDGLVLDSTQLQQQQQQQQGPVEAVSDMMSAGDNGCEADQQGLQLPAVVPYSSFRDSGHFPTQVFTMDYEEQHLVVVDDVDSHDEHDSDDDDGNDDNGAQEPQSSFRPFSPTTTASLLIHNTDSDTLLPPSSPTTPSKKGGLATLAAVLFKTKDVSHHHAMPLCQPNGNGSHPCLGTSPPMAAPLALISRVNIETSASSTTLMSASSPSPIAAKAVLGEGGSRARPLSVATTTGASSIANWEPIPFYRDLETDVIGGSAATDSNKSLPSKKEVVAGTSTETTSNQVHGAASVDTTEESQSGGDDVVNSEDLGSNTVTTPTAGSSWGPSSLFKAWLPSKRKGKARSAKSKDRSDLGSSEARDAVYPEGSEVTTAITTTTTMMGKGSDDVIPVKEQSVAWTMLMSQAPSAIVTSTAAAEAAGEGGAERLQQQLSPME
ncbi:hypothetical protein BGX24_006556 [Mortierella sp. AD032]|nr:hypothetical protein BGX24_006556 [Mortierella sp. AD032]